MVSLHFLLFLWTFRETHAYYRSCYVSMDLVEPQDDTSAISTLVCSFSAGCRSSGFEFWEWYFNGTKTSGYRGRTKRDADTDDLLKGLVDSLPNFTFRPLFTSHRFEIDNMTARDSGQYTCKTELNGRGREITCILDGSTGNFDCPGNHLTIVGILCIIGAVIFYIFVQYVRRRAFS